MAGAGEAGVTMAEAMALLDSCGMQESGCFACDTDAYVVMQRRSPDAGDGITNQRMVAAATEAGLTGLPLEEATYTPWRLVPDTEAIAASLAEHPHRDPGHPSKIIDGEPERVVDHLGSDTAPDNMRRRMVNCAYACGKAGVGNCPVLLLAGNRD